MSTSYNLSMVEAMLPPGFRFHPRDDELICDYLAPSKLDDRGNNNMMMMMMIDIDLNKCEPWELPDMACVGSKEWYFFNLQDRKYATGQRMNRATTSGYWKATGKDRQVVRKGTLVGMRKTLVFYQGRAPKGKKTDWVMHEFRSEGRNDPSPRLISCKEDWVLCRVFYKSRGIGTSLKPKTKESCDEDTGSSSLPPLTETCNNIVFNQTYTFPPVPPPPPTTINTTLLEQVPCFSNYHQIIMNPTMEMNKNFSIDHHLTSTCLKSVLGPFCENGDEAASSESYLTENADISSPMWFPNFQS